MEKKDDTAIPMSSARRTKPVVVKIDALNKNDTTCKKGVLVTVNGKVSQIELKDDGKLLENKDIEKILNEEMWTVIEIQNMLDDQLDGQLYIVFSTSKSLYERLKQPVPPKNETVNKWFQGFGIPTLYGSCFFCPKHKQDVW
jgi:hypothetical protein